MAISNSYLLVYQAGQHDVFEKNGGTRIEQSPGAQGSQGYS